MTLKINVTFLACVVALSSAAVGNEDSNVNQPKRSQTTEALRRLKNAVVENTTAKDNKGNVIESIKCLPEDLKAEITSSQQCPILLYPESTDQNGQRIPRTMMSGFEWKGHKYIANESKVNDLGNWMYSSKARFVTELTKEIIKQSKDILIVTNIQPLDPTSITNLQNTKINLNTVYRLVGHSQNECRYRIAKSKISLERGCIRFKKEGTSVKKDTPVNTSAQDAVTSNKDDKKKRRTSIGSEQTSIK